MKSKPYNLGNKVYAVIGLKIITAIVTGVIYKVNIENISDKIEETNTCFEYYVSAINENGILDTYPFIVSTDNVFTDITKAAAVVGNKAMKV